MPHLEAGEHSLILFQPRAPDDIQDAWKQAWERYGEKFDPFITGWWQEYYHGHIAYLSATSCIVGKDDGWFVTNNRAHWVRPLSDSPDVVCAVEFVPHGESPTLHYSRTDLERGSPLGFGPTRMLPGWDIVGCDDATEYRDYARAAPARETLGSLKRTASGAVLECPSHTIEIDRVWYWLAQEQGLVAERDIEAYAIGWWQERDYAGGPYGVVNLAFDDPQRIWGFHHPPGAPNARWMYLDQWVWEVKPLPASAGKAFWAVEFVRRGERPGLEAPELSLQVPRRTVQGIPVRSPENDPVVLAGGRPELLGSTGREIIAQPLPVLAGLCGLKDRDRIIAFAWDCARWVTDNVVAGETWPAAHRRFWAHIWQNGQRVRYL